MSLKQNIIEEFNELFVAPKPFDDTLYSVAPEVVREFISQQLSLLEQEVRKCVPEREPDECHCDGSGNDVSGFCDCGFSFNDCRQQVLDNLDKLFNN